MLFLSTGDELQEPGATPVPGKIIDSNTYSLAAQVLEAGGEPIILGIARDTLEETCLKISEGLNADVLVITGGASVGDRDFVKPAIETLGGAIAFWKIRMKPGKPLAFALLQGKPVFALPGNPVAAMVSFELFVRPVLLRSMGHENLFRPKSRAVLSGALKNGGDRVHFVRGLLSRGTDCDHVCVAGSQSSGRLSSMVQGNCLIVAPPCANFVQGQAVEVMLLDPSFISGPIT